MAVAPYLTERVREHAFMIAGQDLEALIRMFEQSHWRELELHIDGGDVFLSKDRSSHASWEGNVGASALPLSKATEAPGVDNPSPIQSDAEQASVTVPDGCSLVHAPSLGTFYRAPKPGASPFVCVGDVVCEDAELCLIEVMKLFTTLRSGKSGTVVEILVDDGDLVEFGQPLFLIRSDG